MYRAASSGNALSAVSLLTFGVLLGACLGSFANVTVERIPEGRGLGGRSHCVCGAHIPAWLNIPVVSWMLLRGRARCCGARIPAHVAVREGTYALGGAVGMLMLGPAGIVIPAVALGTETALASRLRPASRNGCASAEAEAQLPSSCEADLDEIVESA